MNRQPDAATPLLRALTPSIYLPTAIFAIGSGAVQPVLVLAGTDVGLSHAAAAGVVGLLGIVGVVSAPLAGGVVARIGGKRAMVAGTVIAVAAVTAILIVMTWNMAWAAHVFIGAIVLQAVASNLWALARQGYIADAVPSWARARALSFLGGMMRLGVLVGPALGAGVIVIGGRRGPFLLEALAALAALGFVLACALPPELLHSPTVQQSAACPSLAAADAKVCDPQGKLQGKSADQDGRTASSHQSLRPPASRSRVDLPATAVVAIAMTILQLMRTNRTVVVPLWGAHLGMSDALISATFAAGALLDVAMFIPSGRWMDRYGRLAGIVPALMIMGVSLVVTIVWTTPAGFVLGTCLMGFGNGFGSGIVMTMGADLAPNPGREKFLGWWQGIGNIGSAAGPAMVSALTATIGLTAGMWATAAMGIFGGVWAASAMRWAYAHAGMDMRGRALPRS